jgi:exosome complex component RRP45
MGHPDVLVSVNDREFILEALRKNLRVDGRGPFDSRPVAYRFGPGDGTCEVSLGSTRVLAVVSASLEPPSGGRGNEGSVTIHVEFSPMASPNFEQGRPGEEASELAVLLERAVRETGAVDVESLCVLAGKRVWHVRCDVHVIDHCGNIAGAASLAAGAALLSFRRPEATVDPQTQRVVIHPADAREPVPLALHHLPVAVTFGFFAESEGLVVMDPSVREEAVLGSDLIVVLNAHGELCALRKGGGCAVDPAETTRCVRFAADAAEDIVDQLKAAHAEWERERDARRVRRHYGAEAAAAANPDRGLPGRGDRGEEEEPSGGNLSAAERGRTKTKTAAAVEDEEEDLGDSDSDEDHAGEEDEDDEGEDDEAVEMSEEEEEGEEEAAGEGDATREEVEPPGRGGSGSAARAAADASDDDDDDVLGAFDAAAKRHEAGAKKKKAKKKATWDDLPGDEDDLAKAIVAKVSKKKKRAKKKAGAA